MAKLNQIIAVEKGIKSRSHQELSDAHHALQKPALLAGIARTYQPKDEEGEKFPPESTRVQIRAEELLKKTQEILTRLFDVTATKDLTNCRAKADVVVDGRVLLKSVPATYLLFLEKQLVDLHTFVKKLPELDPSEMWVQDAAQGLWATEPVQTAKTKKVPRNHIKAEATDKHPAQVDVYYEDIVVGLLEDGEVLRRLARLPHPGHAGARGEAPAGGEVRPRGGQQYRSRGDESRRRPVRLRVR